MSNYGMPVPQPERKDRWFYKCPTCLSVVAVDGRAESLVCSLCNVQMANMGRVQGQRLVRAELLTPCDDRCTGAQGPACNCQCLGKNHGTRALVEVTRDAGGVSTSALSVAGMGGLWRVTPNARTGSRVSVVAVPVRLAPSTKDHAKVRPRPG